MLVAEKQMLIEGALECADALVTKSDESELLKALKQQAGPDHAAQPA